jgi:hypothetical protein
MPILDSHGTFENGPSVNDSNMLIPALEVMIVTKSLQLPCVLCQMQHALAVLVDNISL